MSVPIDEDIHIIGIEPVVDSRTSEYVHHFIVTGIDHPWNSTLNSRQGYPGFEVVYVWAPGYMALHLPVIIAASLGVSGKTSFRLEIHYNNPELDSGKLDSSGVKFHCTSKKRQNDLGVYAFGDPYVRLTSTSVSNNTDFAEHLFSCPGDCSSSFLQEPATDILEHLHMHKIGKSMENIRPEIIKSYVQVYFSGTSNNKGALAWSNNRSLFNPVIASKQRADTTEGTQKSSV